MNAVPTIARGTDDSYLTAEFAGRKYRINVIRSKRRKKNFLIRAEYRSCSFNLFIPEASDPFVLARYKSDWIRSVLEEKPFCLPEGDRAAYWAEKDKAEAAVRDEPPPAPKHHYSDSWIEKGADDSHLIAQIPGFCARIDILRSARLKSMSHMEFDPDKRTFTLKLPLGADASKAAEGYLPWMKKSLIVAEILLGPENSPRTLGARWLSELSEAPSQGGIQASAAEESRNEGAVADDADDWLGRLPGEHVIEIRGRRIPYVIKPHGGRRRMSVVIVPGRGVEVRTPTWNASRAAAERYLREIADWLMANLPLAKKVPLELRDGAFIPYRGKKAVLRLGAKSNLVVPVPDGYELWLTLPKGSSEEAVRISLAALLKEAAWRIINDCWMRVIPKAKRLPKGWKLSDARSRWGVCSSKDNIRLSWRLIALSDEEIEYVAAHELAHLMEFNHSPAFWREVGEILPDWRERHERIEARRMNEMLDAL